MGQNKLERFAAIRAFPNVLEYPENMAGQWSHFFKNDHPLTLELACGKGEYAVGLGKMHPETNFLGVDVKGNRIFIGARKALEEGLANVAFMRTQIERIDQYFAADEVASIWLTFPDPQLRRSRQKKRLTHPVFLRRYQHFLKPGATIHLKTDSPVLYRFTKKVIELYGCRLVTDYDNVYAHASEPELLNIQTHYEGLDIAQSGRIHYLCFTLSDHLPIHTDTLLKQWVFDTEEDTGTDSENQP